MMTRGPGRPPKNEGKSLDARIEFRASSDELTRFRAAAERSNVGLSDWIRDTLNAVTNQPDLDHLDTLKLQNPKPAGKMKKVQER